MAINKHFQKTYCQIYNSDCLLLPCCSKMCDVIANQYMKDFLKSIPAEATFYKPIKNEYDKWSKSNE